MSATAGCDHSSSAPNRVRSRSTRLPITYGWQHHRRLQDRRHRSEEHTSELQSHSDIVCRLLLEKKKKKPLAKCHSIIPYIHTQTRQSVTPYMGSMGSRLIRLVLLLMCLAVMCGCFFFFNDTATTEIYTLSLHDALPILRLPRAGQRWHPWRAVSARP